MNFVFQILNMIVGNASGVNESSRNVTIRTPQDAETPLNEPPDLDQLSFNCFAFSAPPKFLQNVKKQEACTLRNDTQWCGC
jgi:hypothetical protein